MNTAMLKAHFDANINALERFYDRSFYETTDPDLRCVYSNMLELLMYTSFESLDKTVEIWKMSLLHAESKLVKCKANKRFFANFTIHLRKIVGWMFQVYYWRYGRFYSEETYTDEYTYKGKTYEYEVTLYDSLSKLEHWRSKRINEWNAEVYFLFGF